MIPPPLPGPIDINLHSGPAEWWQFLAGLAPLAALIAAGIAAWIAWKSLRQTTAADNRAEWWRRAEWALDSILSEEPRRAQAGLQVMTVLASSTPGSDELKILSAATVELMDSADTRSNTSTSRHDPIRSCTEKVPDDLPDNQVGNASVDKTNPGV